jgi:hypothetical protein
MVPYDPTDIMRDDWHENRKSSEESTVIHSDLSYHGFCLLRFGAMLPARNLQTFQSDNGGGTAFLKPYFLCIQAFLTITAEVLMARIKYV